MVLSLQGSMAAEKASAVNYLKENDSKRARTFFEHYLKYLLPLKKEWFSKKKNVDYLLVDDLSQQEVAFKVREWVDCCIRSYS